METTLKDLLHAINILGEYRDVVVDGIDAIAVCSPVRITPAGMEHFQQALSAKVEVEYKNDCHCATYVSDDDESVNEKAWKLLSSLAGNCSERKFQQWFEGEDAVII